ncbi:MAG: SsrA-binding protein SmpB [Candidatus Omnitrophica bacterium]|nr:SsrA-binding protein SmpB [Candidatus Omnitrophota bacterium]
MADTIIATNRHARFEYNILESLETGIALTGTEVKSLRTGKAGLANSFARIEGTEIFLHGMHIAPYSFGNIANPDPLRSRKLLLHKKQIRHLIAEVTTKKLTLIPLKAYFKNGIVKIELALARGKKLYDKRDVIKKRDMDRELKRISRSRS